MIALLVFCTGTHADAATIIQDDAEIFTEGEKTELTSQADALEQTYKTSVYIVTNPTLSMSDNYSGAAEDFVAAQGEDDAVILIIGMCPGDRVFEIQGYGIAQEYINNTRANRIATAMEDEMRAGKYYAACSYFIQRSVRSLKYKPMFDSLVFNSLAQLLFCILVSVLLLFITIKNYGAKVTTNDRTYLDASASHLIGHFDRFIRTSVTRTRKSSSNSGSGGGGGGGHSSSGGHSF